MHRTARVQSLDRGLAIIEALARERRLLGVREIADELEVSHSTASRLAATLRDRGFLDQERHGGRYALGLRLTRYARLAVAASALEVAARPVIEMLVEELGETVSLGIPVIGGVMVVWSEAPREGPLRITLEPGTVVRYTSSAAGRAILAAMSPAERDAVLPLGWRGRTLPRGGRSLEEFVKELAATIVRGHAIELTEGDPEVASVAVAVHDDEGDVIGALSCSMPIGSASTPRIASVAEALSAGASDIAARRAGTGLHRWSIPAIDSITYWTPDLEPAIDELEERLGVRPALGGRGLGEGTCTAVLSIGGGSYLLVTGPDPDQDVPTTSGPDHPSLRGWNARVRNFDQCVEAARAAGADFGPVRRAGRDRPDGVSLRWKVAAIDRPLGDLLPRLVDWGETEEHPAATSPGGVKLVAFRGEHPEPELIRSQLDVLGLAADLEVTRGPEPRLPGHPRGPERTRRTELQLALPPPLRSPLPEGEGEGEGASPECRRAIGALGVARVVRRAWIPAFAGMTKKGLRSPLPEGEGEGASPECRRAIGALGVARVVRRAWIPAFAGMTGRGSGPLSPRVRVRAPRRSVVAPSGLSGRAGGPARLDSGFRRNDEEGAPVPSPRG